MEYTFWNIWWSLLSNFFLMDEKHGRIFQVICFYVRYENHISNHTKKIKKKLKLNWKIDCSETFIAIPPPPPPPPPPRHTHTHTYTSTPYFDYKHHNTVKFFVCVLPNSTITFTSKAYTGSLKPLSANFAKWSNTLSFSDVLPRESNIMAGKGFNHF